MARTKDVVLAPEQTELMEKKYLDFVKPSTYGNKANPSSCNSLYDDVENPELRAIVEKVAATTPYREETYRTEPSAFSRQTSVSTGRNVTTDVVFKAILHLLITINFNKAYRYNPSSEQLLHQRKHLQGIDPCPK